jgi:indole-3-glycerol phosphate synthase
MSILSEILEVKKEEVAVLHGKYNRSSFAEFEMFAKQTLNFQNALSDKSRINVIAEIKKASPSKGILKEKFNHIEIAQTYFSNGANAVSILTDERFFLGSLNYLKDIAHIKKVPLLRKDFIIDEFQILEAKAYGADAILLIAEALSKDQIKELTSAAAENQLNVLLEIHSARQLDKIGFNLNKIIGVNNRDLESFEVDLNTTVEIAELLPDNILIVSESGVSSQSNLDKLKQTKVNAVLVGEHFMKSNDIGKSLSHFVEWCQYES